MRKIVYTFLVVLFAIYSSHAQYGFGTNNPDASSAFDVTATDKGILLPRVALTGSNDQTTIASPAVSLLIYNTAEVAGDHSINPGYHYWDGTIWKSIESNGETTGDIQYWDGTKWLNITAGTEGQILSMVGGIPQWITAAGITRLPQLTTAAIENIDKNTATGGGNILIDGSSPVTARGICWNTTGAPTISIDNFTNDGAGAGVFTSNMTLLTQNTTYYVRAYASTSDGTSYGNLVSFKTTGLQIGDTYEGGYVFYLDGSGHGLVCAPDNQGSDNWGCSGALPGADGAALGSGAQNTIDIVAGCLDANCAARVCSDLVLGGYSDWFLPSLDEMHSIYTNLTLAGLGNIGQDFGEYYWTSTESTEGYAWVTKLSYNVNTKIYSYSEHSYYKPNSYRIRPVRAF